MAIPPQFLKNMKTKADGPSANKPNMQGKIVREGSHFAWSIAGKSGTAPNYGAAVMAMRKAAATAALSKDGAKGPMEQKVAAKK